MFVYLFLIKDLFYFIRKLLIPYARMARDKLTSNTGPQGRINKIRQVITELVRKERLTIFKFNLSLKKLI